MTQKERMLAGLPYKAWLDGLSEERMACRRKLHAFNLLPPDEEEKAQRLLLELLGKTGRGAWCPGTFPNVWWPWAARAGLSGGSRRRTGNTTVKTACLTWRTIDRRWNNGRRRIPAE